jgi:ABC-type transport system involved in multi-copper enzyme maturation permease subunit
MFQNANNLYIWIPVIAIISLAISWLYYFWRKDQNTFSKPIKFLLFSLRALALFVIGILLLGLIFPRKQTRTEPANIFFLIDQSSSMLNYADSATVKSNIPMFIEAAKQKLDGLYLTRFIHFSSAIHPDDTLLFDGASSNLALGFSHIRDLFINNNLGAIVLLSDGNFNEGLNPKYEAEKIKFTPVYTLAVGDTITKRDDF